MDSLINRIDKENKQQELNYIQTELFRFWNGRIPATALQQQPAKVEKVRYSSHLYLDLFDPLFGLNREQIVLLQATENFIAVTGAPGSGKSSLLLTMAAYWLKQGKCKPSEILILSYTEKEIPWLGQTLEMMLGDQSSELMILTPESFCFRLLAGSQYRTARLFYREERLCFLSLIFPYLSTTEVAALSGYIEEYGRERADRDQEKGELVEAYLSSLEKIGAFDMASLILQAGRLLAENPGVLARLRHQYKAILIDDFQNIDLPQYRILNLMINEEMIRQPGSRKQKIIIFNDHHQAVTSLPFKQNPLYYRFLAEVAEKEIVFSKNYRSRQPIPAAAVRLMKKAAKGRRGAAGRDSTRSNHLRVFRVTDERAEAEFITHSIVSMLEPTTGAGSLSPGGIAITYPASLDTGQLAACLNQAGLPVYQHSALPFNREPPLVSLLALFYFMLNQKDIIALGEILTNLLPEFTASDIQGLFMAGNRREETLAMLASRLYTSHQLSDEQFGGLSRLFKFTKDLKRTAYGQGIAAALRLCNAEFPGLLRKFQGIEFELLLQLAEGYENRIVDFLAAFPFSGLEMKLRYQQERIHLLPMEKMKGLVCGIIFIIGMEEGTCPGYTADFELEQRLFYLALTRAREQVILTSACSRQGRPLSPSSFLNRLGVESIMRDAESGNQPYGQPELLPG